MAELDEEKLNELRSLEVREAHEARILAHNELVKSLTERGITGILNNVAFGRNRDGVNISGTIEIDIKGRFRYNQIVYTSIVEGVYEEDGLWYVKTHYSLYQVNFIEGTEIPEKFLDAK